MARSLSRVEVIRNLVIGNFKFANFRSRNGSDSFPKIQLQITNHKLQIFSSDFASHAEIESPHRVSVFAAPLVRFWRGNFATMQQRSRSRRRLLPRIMVWQQNGGLLQRQGAIVVQKCAVVAASRLRVRFVEQKHAGALDPARARWPQSLVHTAGKFMTSVSAFSSRPVSRRTSSILCVRLRPAELRRGPAKNSRFSRAERRGKNDAGAATAIPTCRRTSPASRRGSEGRPRAPIRPSGSSMVEISLRAVCLPLPFGPSSTTPRRWHAEKETSCSATVSRAVPSRQLTEPGGGEKAYRRIRRRCDP